MQMLSCLPRVMVLTTAILLPGCQSDTDQASLNAPDSSVQPVAMAPARPDPGKQQVGKASWYGSRHHGRKTASGEIFDANDMTAAHRTLPLGSRVAVTNMENGKTVEVTVNDRGPYGKGRVIDLSRAAAEALDIKHDGVATVRVEPLQEAEK